MYILYMMYNFIMNTFLNEYIYIYKNSHFSKKKDVILHVLSGHQTMSEIKIHLAKMPHSEPSSCAPCNTPLLIKI